jgi:putative hydrolase of the HAD superfamily
MIRAVAFDLWETLITDTPALSRRQERQRLDRLEQTLRAHGYAATAERIESAYRDTWRRCHELYWSNDDDVPCRRQIDHMLEALELDPRTFPADALGQLEDAYAEAVVTIPPQTVPYAAESVVALRERGHRIGLISNTGRSPGRALRRVLDDLGIGQSIHVMIFSDEHGACKPRRSIFEALRERLALPFDEIAFVGDNIYADVHGSMQCGMFGIHFTPPVRGTAVAPEIDHGLRIIPDATIADLRELPAVIEGLEA